MTSRLSGGEVLAGQLPTALAIDAVWLSVASALLVRASRSVRVRGLLSRPGY